jgi:hypothetical protein
MRLPGRFKTDVVQFVGLTTDADVIDDVANSA